MDEHQHESYALSCEISRMAKILEILTLQGNTLPIQFIRYNPHTFKKDNETYRIKQKQRHATLIDTIFTTTFLNHFSVKYLFYTSYNNVPVVLNDPEFNENFKEFVELS